MDIKKIIIKRNRALAAGILSVVLAFTCVFSATGEVYADQNNNYGNYGSKSLLVKEQAPDEKNIADDDAVSDNVTVDEEGRIIKEETILSNVKRNIFIKNYRKDASDKILVSPAYGRKVHIQYYSKKLKAWRICKSYSTADDEVAELTITYPDKWRNYNISSWRIYCDELDTPTLYAPSKVIDTTIKNQQFLGCRAAILMDVDSGKILYQYNAFSRKKIASMTKMMSAILLSENKEPSDNIRISRYAARTPYAMGLKAGDSTSVKNILYAMMLPSSNEAATATGENIAGSEKKFVKMMNEKARDIGCKNTNYTNAHGLDTKYNYSTAYDVALIGRYILQSETTSLVRKAMRTRRYCFKTDKGRSYELNTTDRMLSSDKDYMGMKTGTTGAAGYCFCGAFKYGGKTYISVVIGARSHNGRWANTGKLREYLIWRIKNRELIN